MRGERNRLGNESERNSWRKERKIEVDKRRTIEITKEWERKKLERKRVERDNERVKSEEKEESERDNESSNSKQKNPKNRAI